ncbi:36.4 kDa proline-rich protein-like [Phalaenopsis equestris]|uniref:36.4 kDa proline-rich protein-like n=1 Tax=Phalaenopsis equestris TaxID=78828 RepID=UPI0009E390C4|nr:36.4 kDa proline-rich protein-like [Phalaenopsis equestris]
MDSSSMVYVFLLILVTSFSSFFQVAFDSGACRKPVTPNPAPKDRLIIIPPIIEKLHIILPPTIEKSRFKIPPAVGGPHIPFPQHFIKPPVTLHTIIKPNITIPPIMGKQHITLPPITVNPPINKPLLTGKPGSSSLPAHKNTCPLDILKFGTCLDLLRSAIQIGDPTLNECCPLIKGFTEIEAMTCLFTAIKLKFFNIYMVYPIVVDLLISCGKAGKHFL